MRYLEVVEKHIAIVHWCIAILGSDIAYCDSRQRFVGLHVADLYDEGLRPVVDILFGVL
jgi:hypothetical protein